MGSDAPMRGRRHMGGCTCRDCGSYDPPSRASEKHDWKNEVDSDLTAEEYAEAARYAAGPAMMPPPEYLTYLRASAEKGEIPTRHITREEERDLAAYYQNHKDDPDMWGDPDNSTMIHPKRLNIRFTLQFTPDEFDRLSVQATAMNASSISAWMKACILHAAPPLLTDDIPDDTETRGGAS